MVCMTFSGFQSLLNSIRLSSMIVPSRSSSMFIGIIGMTFLLVHMHIHMHMHTHIHMHMHRHFTTASQKNERMER